MVHDQAIRQHLLALLRGGNAHVTFEKAVEGFPVDLAGTRVEGLPHSAWELVEHIRIAQRDILDFTRGEGYRELQWPEDYWPSSQGPEAPEGWHDSLCTIAADRAQFEALLEDPERDLTTPFTWGDGQTLLREALLIADHNAYHVGQLVQLRRALEKW